MFGWLKKDPIKALEKELEAKLKQARDLQRNGDIKGFAAMTSEAEKIGEELDRLRAAASS